MKITKLHILPEGYSLKKDFDFVATTGPDAKSALKHLKDTVKKNFADANLIMAVTLDCDLTGAVASGQAVEVEGP